MIQWVQDRRVALVCLAIAIAMVTAVQLLERKFPYVDDHDAFMNGCQADGIHKTVCASYWWKRRS